MGIGSKSNSEFMKSLSVEGRKIMSELALIGKDKKWLEKVLGITQPSVDGRLKGNIKLSDDEMEMIKKAIDQEAKSQNAQV